VYMENDGGSKMDKQFHTTMDYNNPIIKSHLVYGQALLPGLAYVDILFQMAQSTGFDIRKTVLKNISIFNPLIVREDLSVDITISFTEYQGYYKILVEGKEKGIHGANPQAQKKYISAELHQDDAIAFDQIIDIEEIKKRAKQIVDLEEGIYALARKNGLVHQDIIKADGKMYLSDEGGLIQLAVPANYIEDAEDYIFHPTLIDGSATAAGLIIQHAAPEKRGNLFENLFIPLFYEAFFATESLQTQCYARVQKSNIKFANDIIYIDIEFFNEKGKQVGVLKRLTSKLIRSEEQFNSKKMVNKQKPDVLKTVTKPLHDKTRANKTWQSILTNTFGKYLNMKPHQINTQQGFFELGLESAQLLEVLKEIENILDETLNPTLLFEYNNIEELIGYFEQKKPIKESVYQGTTNKKLANDTIVESQKIASEANQSVIKQAQEMDIAIIALSGRYPKANNIQKFWENLQQGRDCVTEIPTDRWDYSLYYDEDRNKPGKTYSKWGGFIDGVDKFDPLFFNILPKHAEFIDPQERLFLECVWDLFESIGYTQEILQQMYQSRVGVYVGSMFLQQHFFNADIVAEAAMAISSYGSIANRISYFYNLQGPSVAIDTMCSSSAVAVHTACESLIRGECQVAIAGGVNLSIHPKKYLGLSLAQLIGSRPNCRSFGDGDGYMPAEGVGAVLLKPLSKAIQDKDSILAVIKSTTTNHGGRGNGFTVPNVNSQARLFEDNFIKSGIDPRTISYVEAFANGSALGDPIEVSALTKTFQKYTADKQFCAIGSVKSNIGHAEAVSGMSQLTKVILQLQHQQLVPSIKAEPLNPKISFDNTPFYLQRELQEWKRPILMVNGEKQEYPRRATVSSFGAGGSNAHIIVEEYIPVHEENVNDCSTDTPQIVIFSAKKQERLLAVVEQMLEFVERQTEFNLANFAYTLQVGREAMECRLAMVVSDQRELITGLKAFLKCVKEDKAIDDSIPIFTSNLGEDESEIREFLSGNLGETVVQVLLAEENLEKIALYWTKIGKIPWEVLHKGQSVQRIYLPTYPFARERYWVATNEAISHQSNSTSQSEAEELVFTINPNKSMRQNVQDYMIYVLSEKLYIAQEQIQLNKNIYDYGIDSIIMMKFAGDFEQQFQTQITLREILEYETLDSLTTYLAKKVENQNHQNKEQTINSKLEQNHQKTSEDIDEQVVKVLERLAEGGLDVTEAQKLLERGQAI